MTENKFIEKFCHKTDSELKFILENRKKYNEQAIAATIHILNKRNGISLEIESIEKEIETEKEKKIIAQKNRKKVEQNKWYKEYYAGKLLWFGIACICCAFYFFAPTLFTTKKSLVETRGEILIVKIFYNQVSSKGHKSVKSELILKLENDSRIYRLVKNIGQSWKNEKYELIEKKLKKSGKAIVWIKKSEQSNIEPEVFQIASGENDILYDMEDVKSELRFLFPFLLIMGFFGIGVYINHKYPNRIKKLIGKKLNKNLELS